MRSEQIAEYFATIKAKLDKASFSSAEKVLNNFAKTKIVSSAKATQGLKKETKAIDEQALATKKLAAEQKKSDIAERKRVAAAKREGRELLALQKASERINSRIMKSVKMWTPSPAKVAKPSASSLMNSHIPAFRAHQALQKQIQKIESSVRYFTPKIAKVQAKLTPDLMTGHLDAFKANQSLQKQQAFMDRMHGQALELNKKFDARRVAQEEAVQRRLNSIRRKSLGARSSVSPTGAHLGGMGTMWHGALAGTGILSGFGLRALNTRFREIQQMPVSLEAVTGSSERAQSELNYLKGLSREVATPLNAIAPDYSKFLASAMGKPLEKNAREIFKQTLRYSKIMGLDKNATKGVLKAITQITNKDKIMAEELTNQLGDWLPGVTSMMASAAGVDTKTLYKMMEQGKLDPTTYLPKLAQEMANKSNRGQSKWKESLGFAQDITDVTFGEKLMMMEGAGGGDALTRMWMGLNDTLNESDFLFEAVARTMGSVARIVEGSADTMRAYSTVLTGLNKLLPETAKNFDFLGASVVAASLIMSSRLRTAFLPLTAAYLVMQDIGTYLNGGESVTGWLMGQDFSADGKKTIPSGLKNPNIGRFKGQFLGGALENAILQDTANPTLWNAAKVGALSGANAFGEMFAIPFRFFSDLSVDTNKFKYGETSIFDMFSSENNALQLQGFSNSLMKGTTSSLGNVFKDPTFHIEIHSATGDGEEIWSMINSKIQQQTTRTLSNMSGDE